jgi:hypothetical protein
VLSLNTNVSPLVDQKWGVGHRLFLSEDTELRKTPETSSAANDILRNCWVDHELSEEKGYKDYFTVPDSEGQGTYNHYVP